MEPRFVGNMYYMVSPYIKWSKKFKLTLELLQLGSWKKAIFGAQKKSGKDFF